MTALAVTIGFFYIVGAGFGAMRQSDAGRVAGAAEVFLLGVAANGITLYLCGVLWVPLHYAMAGVPSLALAVAVVCRRRGTTAVRAAHHSGTATFFLAVPLTMLLMAAAVLPIRDYDGRVTWLPKAAAIARDGRLDGPFFQGRAGLNLHNHYPLLVPIDAAAVMWFSRSTENESARWLYPLIVIAGLLAAREQLARVAPSSAAWVVAGVAWLPMMVAVEGGALSAYSDFPLAMLGGAATLLLLSREGPDGRLAAAALCLAALVLTKNEGLTMALSIFVAANVTGRVTSWRERLALGAPAVGAILLLAVWRRSVPQAYDEQYSSLLRDLPHSLMRTPDALVAMIRHAADPRAWGWFWAIALAAAVVGAFGRHRRALYFPAAVIGLTLAADLAAFAVTSWNIDELAGVAANRLLVHLILPAAALLAFGGETIIEWSRRGRRGPDPDTLPRS